MSENLLCPDQKTTNDAFRDGYDEIAWDGKKREYGWERTELPELDICDHNGWIKYADNSDEGICTRCGSGVVFERESK